MSREKSWEGFDYVTAQKITKSRSEWRQLIADARHTVRAGGDLLIYGERGLTYEVYDKAVA